MASGTRPRMVQRLVIRIGRNRVRPALSSASLNGIPSPRSWPMYSIRMMPFLTSRPIKRIAPMNGRDIERRSGDPEGKEGARERHRLCEKDEDRKRQAVELKAEEQEHEGGRNNEDGCEARERFLLRPVVPGKLEAVAGRRISAAASFD